jgi:hypothetical protein
VVRDLVNEVEGHKGCGNPQLRGRSHVISLPIEHERGRDGTLERERGWEFETEIVGLHSVLDFVLSKLRLGLTECRFK